MTRLRPVCWRLDSYLFTEPPGAKPGGNRRTGIRLTAVFAAFLVSAGYDATFALPVLLKPAPCAPAPSG